MTYNELGNLLHKHNIPTNAKLQSDCDEGQDSSRSEVNGVYYNPETNVIVLVQEFEPLETIFHKYRNWIPLR